MMDWLTKLIDLLVEISDPLQLVGYVVLLLFIAFFLLLKKDLLRPLSQKYSERFVNRFFLYGFIIALLVILLGFLPSILESVTGRRIVSARFDATAIAENLIKSNNQIMTTIENQRQYFERIVEALNEVNRQLKERHVPDEIRHQVYQELWQRRTEKAEAILERSIADKQSQGDSGRREAAVLARHLAALTAGRDPDKMVRSLQLSLRFEPDQAGTWRQLSNLMPKQQKSAVSRAFSLYARRTDHLPVANALSSEFTMFRASALETSKGAASRSAALYAWAEPEESSPGRACSLFADAAGESAQTGREISLIRNQADMNAVPSREAALWLEGAQ